VHAAFDALLAKFSSGMVVQELCQGPNTNEHSAELVAELTRRMHQRG
jgi:hypothetical protein